MWMSKVRCFEFLGCFAILSGIISFAAYDSLYSYIMKLQMVVEEGSYSYSMWQKTPIPMYNKIYYFNCTNAHDVMKYNSKPLLKQVGPYVFREEHEKTNITFNKSDYTVQYMQKKFWYFDAEKSSGSLDDEIFTLNMVAVAASDATRYPGRFGEDDYPFMRGMMDMALGFCNEEMFIKVRVGNLTFDGVDSEMLHMGDVDGDLGEAIGANIPYDKFGWFYARNGSESYDGLFEMYTGEDDIYKVGQISRWNNKNNLGDLYPQPCDRLEGSAGEFFPQDQGKTSISYFTPDLCRPIHFNFKEETKVMGVSGYKYMLDEGFVANSTFNSTNSCYNPELDLMVDLPVDCPSEDDCTDGPPVFHPIGPQLNMHLPNGLLNVSTCKYNSPAYVSFPHFYLADPALLDQFHPDSDLNPNEEEHSAYLSLMPKQGIPLEVAIRMQINILYRPFTGFPIHMFEDTEPTFYPAVWFETTTELPDDLASQLRLLEWVPALGNIMGGVFAGLGLLTLAAVYADRSCRL